MLIMKREYAVVIHTYRIQESKGCSVMGAILKLE